MVGTGKNRDLNMVEVGDRIEEGLLHLDRLHLIRGADADVERCLRFAAVAYGGSGSVWSIDGCQVAPTAKRSGRRISVR